MVSGYQRCDREFWMAANREPYYCTKPTGHSGGHEWDSRMDPSHVDFEPERLCRA